MQPADLCCASSHAECSLYTDAILTEFALNGCSPASQTTGGKRPAASKPPTDLSEDALKLALNAAVLASLAYKTPMEVEYLRQRAKGKTRDEAKTCIFEVSNSG